MTNPEPIDECYRDIVKDSHGETVETRLFKKYGHDDIMYRRAAYNLATSGTEDCEDTPEFRESAARINATNQFHENPVQVQEGVFECPRCGANETLYFEKQSRSADEAATVYCRCKKCGKSWKEN